MPRPFASSSSSTIATAVSTDDDDAFDEKSPAQHAKSVEPQRFGVTAALNGQRLDKALAALLPAVSRTRIQQWIEAGAVLVNGAAARARAEVIEGDLIDVAPPPDPEDSAYVPEPAIAAQLDIVHEDEALIVLNKPAGLVVHPASGNWSGTLLNGLLAYDSALQRVPRAGIVHRLDADTSGLMAVARTIQAQTDLVRQLQARSVKREYWALVFGAPAPEGEIDEPLARDPRNPLRFAVSHSASAKEALTRFRTLRTVEIEGQLLSLVACRLQTGRTHQIRVHMEAIGHPLVGDPVYRRGRPPRLPSAVTTAFERQALHARRLGLSHPVSRAALEWTRQPPPDMQQLLQELGFSLLD